MFANKFACGSSVTKNNQGNDEIVVQGDVSDEIFDLILEHWSIVRASTRTRVLFYFVVVSLCVSTIHALTCLLFVSILLGARG